MPGTAGKERKNFHLEGIHLRGAPLRTRPGPHAVTGWGRGRRWANGGVCARTGACACALFRAVGGVWEEEEGARAAGGAVRRRRGLERGGPGRFFSFIV